MFRFTKKPSSGSHSQYLAKITSLVQCRYRRRTEITSLVQCRNRRRTEVDSAMTA